MLIAFDAKRALANATGLGNYSRFTIEALAREFPGHQYLMYAPGNAKSKSYNVNRLLQRPNISLKTGGGALWRSWGITGDLAADKVNLYHGLSNELPLNIDKAPCPSVVTIHDLIWRRVPGDYSLIDRKLYDLKYGRSARLATRVIAISRKTRDDIVNDFGVDPSAIDIIYQGCDPSFKPVAQPVVEDIKKRYDIDSPYIITVGTVQSRKNQLLAVKALPALPPEVKLVIAGRRHEPYAREIDRYISSHSLGNRVIQLTGVPFCDLPGLYAGAEFATYTSRYEGFGLPVIEALSVGIPVIAATGSCLEEAGGDAALYVNPDDTEAMVDACRRLLNDSSLRHRLLNNAPKHLQQFNPAEYASNVTNTYQHALQTFLQ